MKQFSICALLGVLALPVAAQDAVTYPFEGSFDDATFSVESAIIGRGLDLRVRRKHRQIRSVSC